jgi:hypothetical protein
MTELKDWLNSINQTKNNIIDEDPLLEKEYSPYVINHCLSGYIDCIMYVNEMNITRNLDKKLQYDFYINTLRVKSRFSTWLRKDVIKDLIKTSKFRVHSPVAQYAYLSI